MDPTEILIAKATSEPLIASDLGIALSAVSHSDTSNITEMARIVSGSLLLAGIDKHTEHSLPDDTHASRTTSPDVTAGEVCDGVLTPASLRHPYIKATWH